MTTVFDPAQLGSLSLANRLVMAPLTRSRAQADGTPSELASTYYEQRASVGLIIAEATQPSEDAQGYMLTPGIHTEAHIGGWKKVIDAVHAQGSRIFIQLLHTGRISHPDNTPHGRQALAPSAIAPDSTIFTPTGMQEVPLPREMTVEDIQKTIADFRFGAKCAIEAGADGVEIHGANAYLIHQFLTPSANQRTDQYGGSMENRARFAIEVAKAIVEEIGAGKTGIRFSPGMNLWGIEEGPEAADLYRYLATELNKLGLVYLHITQYGEDEQLLTDLESYGQMVLANPDFVERLKTDAPMNEADASTYFGGDAKGYTDYPSLTATQIS